LIEYPKAHPEEVNYGYLGIGSFQNMLAKKLEKLTVMKMTGIPYRGALPKRSSRCRGTQSPLNWAATLGHAALQQQAGQGYRDHRGRAAEICPGDPDAERERRPAGDICLAGRIRALGHSAIHRRSAQRQSGGDRDSPEYRSLVEQLGSVAISSTPQEFQKVINETVEKVAPIVQEFSLQLD
jgi:hypothetical protein